MTHFSWCVNGTTWEQQNSPISNTRPHIRNKRYDAFTTDGRGHIRSKQKASLFVVAMASAVGHINIFIKSYWNYKLLKYNFVWRFHFSFLEICKAIFFLFWTCCVAVWQCARLYYSLALHYLILNAVAHGGLPEILPLRQRWDCIFDI